MGYFYFPKVWWGAIPIGGGSNCPFDPMVATALHVQTVSINKRSRIFTEQMQCSALAGLSQPQLEEKAKKYGSGCTVCSPRSTISSSATNASATTSPNSPSARARSQMAGTELLTSTSALLSSELNVLILYLVLFPLAQCKAKKAPRAKSLAVRFPHCTSTLFYLIFGHLYYSEPVTN